MDWERRDGKPEAKLHKTKMQNAMRPSRSLAWLGKFVVTGGWVWVAEAEDEREGDGAFDSCFVLSEY